MERFEPHRTVGLFHLPETGEETMSENEDQQEWEQLDAEHPLVKTLSAQKEQIKKLKAELPDIAELRDKATKYDAAEQANKSELEKAIARAEQAEKAISERERIDAARTLAEEVARDKGLSDPSVLSGDSRESLEAQADKILALFPQKPKVATDGSGGDRGDDIGVEEKPVTPNDLLRAAFQK